MRPLTNVLNDLIQEWYEEEKHNIRTYKFTFDVSYRKQSIDELNNGEILMVCQSKD